METLKILEGVWRLLQVVWGWLLQLYSALSWLYQHRFMVIAALCLLLFIYIADFLLRGDGE